MEVYNYRGNDGERVPEMVEKLIIEEGIQELPGDLCTGREGLLEVTLPNGLAKIGDGSFDWCENLLEITIRSTVQYIGTEAFRNCKLLAKLEFECSASSPHQLQTIDEYAFFLCKSLQRIKLPPSMTAAGSHAFDMCQCLVEANLSTTGVTEISRWGFANCFSLQTVSLPNTVRRIGNRSFQSCSELVTVVVPLDSQSIKIGEMSFSRCRRLANLVIPNDSTAHEESFTGCQLLHERYGEECARIVAGLIGRYEHFAIHRMCYDHSAICVQKLLQCIADQHEGDSLLVDEFGMNPFHVFFSTSERSMELLQVLLDSLPNQILKWKDANEKRPLEYLINNWTDGAKILLQTTLQKSMIDRVTRWGAMSWMETMQSKVQEILAQDEDKEQRTSLCNEAYSLFEHYENVEVTSILEMALWNKKLKSGRTNDGAKRQALDREECRCLSGSDVIIPSIATFLGIINERRD